MLIEHPVHMILIMLQEMLAKGRTDAEAELQKRLDEGRRDGEIEFQKQVKVERDR